MPDISKPFSIPGLNLRPPIDKVVRLSEDMSQVLSQLTAYAINTRVLLRACEQGVLFVTGPRFHEVQHVTGSGANDHPTMPDVPCSEIIVLGHPDNVGKLWVRPGGTASVTNAVPLDADDTMKVSVDNVNKLSILVVADGEKAILVVFK